MKPRITTYFLPAADDYRIYVVTDTHFESRRPHHLDNILAEARAIAPDCIVFAGDTINYLDDLRIPAARQSLRDFFQKLARVAPVYLGLGNHDQMYKSRHFFPEIARREQRVFLDFVKDIPDITVLHNKKVKLSNKPGVPAKINLIGLTLPRSCYQRPGSAATKETKAELQKVLKQHQNLLKKTDKGQTNLLLVHSPRCFTPEVIAELPDIDYIITGHMHQGCIPFGLDELLPGDCGLIAPGYAPFPSRARTPRSRFVRSRAATPVSEEAFLNSIPAGALARSAAEKLLVLPAYKTFAASRRPLNTLFPKSHTILRLTKS